MSRSLAALALVSTLLVACSTTVASEEVAGADATPSAPAATEDLAGPTGQATAQTTSPTPLSAEPTSEPTPPSPRSTEVDPPEQPAVSGSPTRAPRPSAPPEAVPCPGGGPEALQVWPAQDDGPVVGTVVVCGVEVEYDVARLSSIRHVCGDRGGCREIVALPSGCCVHAWLTRPGVAYDPLGTPVEIPEDWASHLARFDGLDVTVQLDGTIVVEGRREGEDGPIVAEGMELWADHGQPARAVLYPVGQGFVIWATRGSVEELHGHTHLVDAELRVAGTASTRGCAEPDEPRSLHVDRHGDTDGEAERHTIEMCGAEVDLAIPPGWTAEWWCGLHDGFRHRCDRLTLGDGEGRSISVTRPPYAWGSHGERVDPPGDWGAHLAALGWLDVDERDDGTLRLAVIGASTHRSVGAGLDLRHRSRTAMLKPLAGGFVAWHVPGDDADEEASLAAVDEVVHVRAAAGAP